MKFPFLRELNEALLPEEVKIEKMAKQLDQQAQAVWAEKDLEKKRELLIKGMVDNFKFKDKQPEFRRKALAAKTTKDLDFIASSILLVGHGEKVVK